MITEALSLLIRAVNLVLAARGERYRLTADTIWSRRDGWTLIALREVNHDQQ